MKAFFAKISESRTNKNQLTYKVKIIDVNVQIFAMFTCSNSTI